MEAYASVDRDERKADMSSIKSPGEINIESGASIDNNPDGELTIEDGISLEAGASVDNVCGDSKIEADASVDNLAGKESKETDHGDLDGELTIEDGISLEAGASVGTDDLKPFSIEDVDGGQTDTKPIDEAPEEIVTIMQTHPSRSYKVNLAVQGEKVNAVVDTAAEGTLISDRVFDRLKVNN